MVERDLVEEARTDENGTGRVKGRKRGYRVRAPLGKLWEEGKVDDRRYDAGKQLLKDYLTSLGAGDRQASSGHNGAMIGPSDSMIMAREAYTRASAKIRAEARIVTLRIVVEERPLGEVLAMMGMPNCGRTWIGMVSLLQDGLIDLADHYWPKKAG